MAGKIVALGLTNLDGLPEGCGGCALWGLKARENIERLLREWGHCGFLALEEKTPVGYMAFGPAKYFLKSGLLPAGPVSRDAILLACLFVEPAARDRGIGKRLLAAVESEAVVRGFSALEAFAVRDGDSPPAMPFDFFIRNGFYVIKDDRRHPRVRLDIGSLSVNNEKDAAIFERARTWISPTNA
jgi:GNAT superfamily N-acetyltransferase